MTHPSTHDSLLNKPITCDIPETLEIVRDWATWHDTNNDCVDCANWLSAEECQSLRPSRLRANDDDHAITG